MKQNLKGTYKQKLPEVGKASTVKGWVELALNNCMELIITYIGLF